MESKIEKHHVVTGKKGIIILNILSRLIVCFGLIALVVTIIVGITGAVELSKVGDDYVELVKGEDFEFKLSAIGVNADEFITMVNDSENAKPLTIFIISLFGMAISELFLLTVYMCAWIVTGSIRKDEHNPFTLDNLKALKKCVTTLIVFFLLSSFVNLIPGFIYSVDFTFSVSLGYIFVVSIFVYLFDCGYKLQEK